MLYEHAVRRSVVTPSFAHLRRLTDDTGLLEHALGRIPRRSEGYTTDDNARALWLVTEWLAAGNKVLDDGTIAKLTELAEIYMAFLLWNQNEDGWWHNNVAYNRTPEQEEKSGNHDCQGRAIWAVADAWVRLEGSLPDTAHIMVQRAMPTLGRIDSRRGQAFVMAACAHMIDADQCGIIRLPGTWRAEMTWHMEQYECLLNKEFRHFTEDGWCWFESAMTYSNGLVPWAMLRTHRVTGRTETRKNGLDSLSFLLEQMTTEDGWLRPIGNEGWGSPDGVSRWDQQPLEMFKLALALEEAARVEGGGETSEEKETVAKPPHADGELVASTAAAASEGALVGNAPSAGTARKPDRTTFAKEQKNRTLILNPERLNRRRNAAYWREMRDLSLSWFYGNNDHRAPMCDPADGSCCDGLMKTGPNINCGAESTLSYLMTEALCRTLN